MDLVVFLFFLFLFSFLFFFFSFFFLSFFSLLNVAFDGIDFPSLHVPMEKPCVGGGEEEGISNFTENLLEMENLNFVRGALRKDNYLSDVKAVSDVTDLSSISMGDVQNSL